VDRLWVEISEFEPQLCPSPDRRPYEAILTFSNLPYQLHKAFVRMYKNAYVMCPHVVLEAQEAHSTFQVPFLS